MDMSLVCPRCRYHGGYHAEDCDWIEEQPPDDELFATREEWREKPL